MTEAVLPPTAENAPEPGASAQSASDRAQVVAELFRNHNRDLLHFIQGRLRGITGDANEVAQEAYVRLLQLENTNTVSFLRAYLFRIAANIIINRQVAHRRRPEDHPQSSEEMEQVADPVDVERTVFAADEYNMFISCLSELPPKCRQAFVLHRLKHKSSEAVANQMGISSRMVRKYVARALIYCRYRLEGMSAQDAMDRVVDEQ